MDLKDLLKLISDNITKLKDMIETEEATKNAFIMPFIQALGYNVFNPLEVVPEFTSDIGTKKGEKIDYAIFNDGKPTILIECKHWKQNLNVHEGQLIRYFNVSKVRFGILTNGIKYRFYSDLVESNKMDEKPFLEIDITDLKDNQIEELKKFHKNLFDPQTIISTANDMKFTNEVKQLLYEELSNPSPEFVKHFAKKVYPGVVSSKILDQFTLITKKSIQQYLNDLITSRLKTALSKEDEVSKEQEQQMSEEQSAKSEKKIVTTEEEIEGFMIVKSILRQKIDISILTINDTLSYLAIYYGKQITICRLYLNGKNKYIAFLDENRKETKYEIKTLDDIYNYTEQLFKAVENLL